MVGGRSELKRGLWTSEEDRMLMEYVQMHGKTKWNRIPKLTGLKRSGKSCRLRWMNYLRPDVKKGNFSSDEDDLIIRLHSLLGNRWSLIAGRIPGRTDNQVKNHWNTHLSKKPGVSDLLMIRKGKKIRTLTSFSGLTNSCSTTKGDEGERDHETTSSNSFAGGGQKPTDQLELLSSTITEAHEDHHTCLQSTDCLRVITNQQQQQEDDQEPAATRWWGNDLFWSHSTLLCGGGTDDMIVDSLSSLDFLDAFWLDFSWD